MRARGPKMTSAAVWAGAAAFFLAICLTTIGGDLEASPARRLASTLDACVARAERMRPPTGAGADTGARWRLAVEIALARCENPADAATASLIGTLNAFYSRAGLDFLMGRLTPGEYRALLDDRRRKLDWLRANRARLLAWTHGDADQDLVPDSLDRCADTPRSATDDQGCAASSTPAPSHDGDVIRRLAQSPTFHNPKCDGLPWPAPSMPMAFGEMGRAASPSFQRLNPKTHTPAPAPAPSPPPSGPPIDFEIDPPKTSRVALPRGPTGVKLQVLRVPSQNAGCELLYELQFVFVQARSVNGPPWPVPFAASVVMRAKEDLGDDPVRASFWLPYSKPLSPVRDKLRTALGHYDRASWRVRVVDGSNKSSPWSPYRLMSASPFNAIGGQRPD